MKSIDLSGRLRLASGMRFEVLVPTRSRSDPSQWMRSQRRMSSRFCARSGTPSPRQPRLRGRIEAVLDAARARKHRSGENPARWRGHLDKFLPRPKKLSRGHHAAMPFEDVPAFVRELRNLKYVSALALEFLILTAARSGEVRSATWDEIDGSTNISTIPAARMKANGTTEFPCPTAASRS